ncbi:hypothetical protein ABKN59_010965 [Abortiporus biennis]
MLYVLFGPNNLAISADFTNISHYYQALALQVTVVVVERLFNGVLVLQSEESERKITVPYVTLSSFMCTSDHTFTHPPTTHTDFSFPCVETKRSHILNTRDERKNKRAGKMSEYILTPSPESGIVGLGRVLIGY